MPLRFNKRISLGKFLRLNISKSGVGVTIGPRGANVTLGPRGSRATVGIPGTGLSYTQKLDNTKVGSFDSLKPDKNPKTQNPKSQLEEPGNSAPEHEKEFIKGLNAFNAGQVEAALPHFLAAARHEAAAAIYAAFTLASRPEGRAQAIELLEGVVGSDAALPDGLMQKYLSAATLPVAISPAVSAEAPLRSSAAPLLLAELYQADGQIDEAISLLDEIAAAAPDPAITLSLCELLAGKGLWDEVIERAKGVEAADAVTLETRLYYGRAMLEKGLAEAAIKVFGEALRKKKAAADLLHEARYWRAVAYERAGKKKQASKEFQLLYADAPDFRDVARRVTA
jgi:tetratricopeptide (TPR) repeat protein